MNLKTFLFLSVFPMAFAAALHAEENDSTPKPGTTPDLSQVMGGDAGDACQMLVCLSDPIGQATDACAAPLKKYFDMKPNKRPGFLQKCPQKE